MGDVIGVMNRGHLEQWDDAYNLYHRPATRFVAQFIGHGVFTPARIVTAGGAGGCAHPLGRWPTCRNARCPTPTRPANATCCCAPTTSCTTTPAR
jgi:iron(III) transport system ATP-binding protein